MWNTRCTLPAALSLEIDSVLTGVADRKEANKENDQQHSQRLIVARH